MYRYILFESCSQFDLLPLLYLLQKAFTAIVESSFEWGGFGAPWPSSDEVQRAQLTAALLWSTALLPAESHLLEALVPRLQAVMQRARTTPRPPLALVDARGANAHTRASVALSFDWIVVEEGSALLNDDFVEAESLVLESEHPFAPNARWLQMIDVRAVDGDTVVVRFDARTSTGVATQVTTPGSESDGEGGAAPASYVQFFFDEACTRAATPRLSGPSGSECWRHTLRIPQAECYLRFQSGGTNSDGSWGYRCSIRGEARRGSTLALVGGAALSAPHISARLLFHAMHSVLTGAAWRREVHLGGDSAVAQRVHASLSKLLDELMFAVDAAVQRYAAYTAYAVACPPAVELRTAAVVGAECHLWLRFLAGTWPRIASLVRVEQAPRVWALLLRIADELPPLVGRHALRTLGVIMPGVPLAGSAERECALPESTLEKLFAMAAQYSPLAPAHGAAMLRCTSDDVPLSSASDRCDRRFARSHCAIEAVELLQNIINRAGTVRAAISVGQPEALCASVAMAVRGMLRGIRAWTPDSKMSYEYLATAVAGIKALNDRSGASLPQLKAYFDSNKKGYKNHMLLKALKAGLGSGVLARHHNNKGSYKFGRTPLAASSPSDESLRRGTLALRIVAGLASSGVVALRLEPDDVMLLVRLATAGSGGVLDAGLVVDRMRRYERDLAADALEAATKMSPGERSAARVGGEWIATDESQEARRAVELAAVADADDVMQRMLEESLRDTVAKSLARPSDARPAGTGDDADKSASKDFLVDTHARHVAVCEAKAAKAFAELVDVRLAVAKTGRPQSNVDALTASACSMVARASANLEESSGTRYSARTIVHSIRAAEARASADPALAVGGAADIDVAKHLVAAGPEFARDVAVVSALRVASVAALASIAQSGREGTALLWSVRDADGDCAVAVALGRLVGQEAEALDGAGVAAKQKATMKAGEVKGPGVGGGGGPQQERRSVVVESTHNYADNMDFSERVTIEGAAELHVVFDSRCQTEKRYDYLEIFGDCTLTTRIGPRFEGSSFPLTDPAHPLVVAGDSLWYTFKSDASTNYWGYAFTVSATVLKTPAANGAPSILRAFPLPRSVDDIVDLLDATLWLQCRVATIADRGGHDAVAAVAQAKAKVNAAGTSLEDLMSSLLRNGARSGAASDEALAKTLNHDEATRTLALELARQVREVLQENARDQEAARALEKFAVEEAKREREEKESAALAAGSTAGKASSSSRSAMKKSKKEARAATKAAHRLRQKAIALSGARTPSITPALEFLHSTSANVPARYAGRPNAGIHTEGFQRPSWGVGDTIAVPHFGRGTIVAWSPTNGNETTSLTLHLTDWVLAGGQRVVVHSNTGALGLGRRHASGGGAESAAIASPAGDDGVLPLDGAGALGSVAADARAGLVEASRAGGVKAAREAPVATVSDSSATAQLSVSDEAPRPPFLRWSRALGRDIALLNGDTVATRTEPGDYSSAGCGWGAHCSTPFGSAGADPAVHEICLTVEEAGVSGRPGGLYVGIVDAGWDWRSHSTSLYQVPECYSYKANSRHREGGFI